MSGSERRDDNRAVTTSALEARRRLVQLLHSGLDLQAFFDACDRQLCLLVPFDSSCWLSLDPSTLLPTSHFTREIEADHLLELAANEFLEDDVNKFADLAQAPRPAAILSQAAGGQLERSTRFQRVLAPHGYADGDELRATFLDGDEAWGCVALHRRHGWFHEGEADAVAGVAAYIAEGIRRAILISSLAAAGTVGAPGLILLDPDNVIETVTPAAASCIAELYDTTSASAELPLVMVAVAERARRASAGDTEEVASARLPTVSGGWVVVDASVLPSGTPGRVGIIVSPTRQPEIAALIVAAHGLSVREREVTRLVLCGLTTDAIASDLHITPYTVQDHLKSIFTKVGVSSRRELVAHLFQQHYAPRLLSGAPVGPTGWFAEAPPDPDQ